MSPPDEKRGAETISGPNAITDDHTAAGGQPDVDAALSSQSSSPGLVLPDVHDADMLSAAITYAKAGIFVLPTAAGSKSPGSVVGQHWQYQSSRDLKQIAAWYAGTGYGIAAHAGRSGLVVFDVDHPDMVPPVLAKHLARADVPYQSTRPDAPGRGHYVFSMPPGRMLGNGVGKLGKGWGEVRGRNGVIVVEPTVHPEGGEYRWQRMGPVPALPEEIAVYLPEAGRSRDAATAVQVRQFIAQHTSGERLDALEKVVAKQRKLIAQGASRHDTTRDSLAWAMEEAAAGFYPAEVAAQRLWEVFRDAVADNTSRNASGEFWGMLAWAVACAKAADVEQRQRKVNEQVPGPAAQIDAPPPRPPDPVDGTQLFNDLLTYLRKYVAYPSIHDARAHALWIGHSWLMDCWQSTPRLAFLSPEPSSGKTRALEVTEPVVPNPIHAVNTTPAYLFRKVGNPAGPPTLLYDEIDTVFGPKAKDNEDIRGMLNAGHRRGAVAGRCVVRGKQVETEEIPAYCAVALAGLGDLPDTIRKRSVIIRMQRRAPGETIQPWRARTSEPEGRALAERLRAWADYMREFAGNHIPEMPEGVVDRDADVWEPLLATADAVTASTNGVSSSRHPSPEPSPESWASSCRVTAVTAVTASRAHAPSRGEQLLQDIWSVFTAAGVQQLVTAQLLENLKVMEDSPWNSWGREATGLSPVQLARYLEPYGIKPRRWKQDGKAVRGYQRADFADAWLRYGTGSARTPTDPSLPSPPSPGASSNGQDPPGSAPPNNHAARDGNLAGSPCLVCGEPAEAGQVHPGCKETNIGNGARRCSGCDGPLALGSAHALCPWCAIEGVSA
ncbi:DUF3631 domain-containing protein [Mycobacteroides abscessus]|uniref:DUF3631 domain-containing protein n=1 Tax=Mycobacteroides abscessus TaxID=36809 RepID=UPI0019D18BC6|nr:DUF3631 domain-containing protein [Mycobacteroides abscessus]MBN7411170.1 DUF3631 domain-containing protein [Mycobacteroides abscessus subsp. abscessus]